MKYIKILLITLSCISLLIGCGKKEEKQDKPKEEEKQQVNQKIEADSFEFTTNSVNFENNNSVFDINIKNIAPEERYINEFLIHVKDESGNDLASLYGYVNETIEPAGERTISCSYGNDLSNYKSLEFEVIK